MKNIDNYLEVNEELRQWIKNQKRFSAKEIASVTGLSFEKVKAIMGDRD